MGLFSSLFGKPNIQHEFFGMLTYVHDKKFPDESYYTCEIPFVNDESIYIYITANGDGPTQQQADFVQSIINSYPRVVSAAFPLIEQQLGKEDSSFSFINFEKEFTPVTIFIPAGDSSNIQWEISFNSDHDVNHSFNITMSDFKALGLSVTG